MFSDMKHMTERTRTHAQKGGRLFSLISLSRPGSGYTTGSITAPTGQSRSRRPLAPSFIVHAQISSRVGPSNTQLRRLYLTFPPQNAAPLRVSMAIPPDVIAAVDCGTEGDAAPLLLGEKDETNPRFGLTRVGVEYFTGRCPALIHNRASKLLPTSCGQQQPDGHGGVVGGGGVDPI